MADTPPDLVLSGVNYGSTVDLRLGYPGNRWRGNDRHAAWHTSYRYESG